MQVIFKFLLLSLILVSCGTSEDSRYRNTAALERPPILPINRQPGEQPVTDNSTITKKRDETGLGADVYMIESTPMQLKIKKPFDYAWRALGLALKQSRIKITDHDQDKGLYYVFYKQKNLFESAATLFKNEQEEEHHEANYVLTVKKDGAETKISATLVNAAEQDSYDDMATPESEALLWALYETLHDDLKEE